MPPAQDRTKRAESINSYNSYNTLIQSAGYVKFIHEGPESAEDYMNLELSAVRLPRSEFEGTEVLEFDGGAIMPIKHQTTGAFVTIIRGSDWTFKTERNVTTVCTPEIAMHWDYTKRCSCFDRKEFPCRINNKQVAKIVFTTLEIQFDGEPAKTAADEFSKEPELRCN